MSAPATPEKQTPEIAAFNHGEGRVEADAVPAVAQDLAQGSSGRPQRHRVGESNSLCDFVGNRFGAL
jgi:hypothetical protein